MAERCPGAELHLVGAVHGYRIDFTRHSPRRGGGVADIVSSHGSAVWGIVFRVGDAHRDSLDLHEGHPRDYRRMGVTVTTREGPIEAFSYEVVAKVAFVEPTAAYLELMLGAAEEHGFPDVYLAELRARARSTVDE